MKKKPIDLTETEQKRIEDICERAIEGLNQVGIAIDQLSKVIEIADDYFEQEEHKSREVSYFNRLRCRASLVFTEFSWFFLRIGKEHINKYAFNAKITLNEKQEEFLFKKGTEIDKIYRSLCPYPTKE